MLNRPSAVAGTFYPAHPFELQRLIQDCWQQAKITETPPPRALIVPHAGYIYSGAIAASAYHTVQTMRAQIRRVVILGPAHRVALRGIAAPQADTFSTPLGYIPVNQEEIADLVHLKLVTRRDDAHAQEHCLEVQLPFLQTLFTQFSILPLLVGQVSVKQVHDIIEKYIDIPDTLILISSDLSHYHHYSVATRIDQQTTVWIEQLQYEALLPEHACGCYAIAGLLALARKRGLSVRTLDLRNSGDTAGSHARVVGYGAYSVH